MALLMLGDTALRVCRETTVASLTLRRFLYFHGQSVKFLPPILTRLSGLSQAKELDLSPSWPSSLPIYTYLSPACAHTHVHMHIHRYSQIWV